MTLLFNDSVKRVMFHYMNTQFGFHSAMDWQTDVLSDVLCTLSLERLVLHFN